MFYTVPEAFCGYSNPDKIDFAQYWYEETPVPQLLVGYQYHPAVIIHLGYMTAVVGLAYICSMILARITVIELKRISPQLSPKTKALQKQLAR
jgi:hypothetical protein